LSNTFLTTLIEMLTFIT